MTNRQTNQRQVVDTAGATLVRDLEQTWRAWTAYIAELQAEIQSQTADAADDLTQSAQPIRRVAKIDPATRQQFGAVIEARRQQSQAAAEAEARKQSRPAPDGEQVYAALLEQIRKELAGEFHSSGMALVWYQGQLVKFDAQAVAAGTTDADYLASGAGSGPTPIQIVGLIGVLVLAIGFVIVIWQWAFGPPPTAQVGPGKARVGQTSVERWDVTGAMIGGTPTIPTMSGATGIPHLCVSTDQLKQAEPGTTLVLSSTQAVRRYQVLPTSDGADLLLGCGETPAHGARLIETLTHTALDPAILSQIQVRGPDLDPQSIPPDQMAVMLDVALPNAGGTLITVDGRRWAATTQSAIAGGTHLSYLIPLASQAQPAGWELPHAGLPQLLTLTIPAPESRQTVLGRVLTVQAGTPVQRSHDGQPTVDLPLTLTLAADASPITLVASDLRLTRNGTSLDGRWDIPRLVPGKPITITVQLPVQPGAVDLTLATWHARLSLG